MADRELLTITGHWRTDLRTPRHHRELEACLVLTWPGRWLRLGLFWGEAPGSRMMGRHACWWRTRTGSFHGVNLRFGWWPEPCLTLLAHTRPEPGPPSRKAG